jgi:hypothetical protein
MSELDQSVDNAPIQTRPTDIGGDPAGVEEPKVNPGQIRKSTTAGILKAAASVTGQEFESTEAFMAYLARVSAQQPQTMAPSQPTAPETKNRVTNTDLHEQFNALRQDLSRKEQALREKELEGDIRQSMGDRFDSDLLDYAISKVKSNIQWEDGAYGIVNAKGQIRYNAYGDPVTIQELVEELAEANPKLLKRSNITGGSGIRGNQGSFAGAPDDAIPDYTRDPAAFNAWAQRNGLGRGVGLKGVSAAVYNSTSSKKIV